MGPNTAGIGATKRWKWQSTSNPPFENDNESLKMITIIKNEITCREACNLVTLRKRNIKVCHKSMDKSVNCCSASPNDNRNENHTRIYRTKN